MTTNFAPQAERKPRVLATFNAVLSGGFALWFSTWASFTLMPPSGWNNDHPFFAISDWLLPFIATSFSQSVMSFTLFSAPDQSTGVFSSFVGYFDQYDLIAPILWRVGIILGATALTAIISSRYTKASVDTKSLLTHIRGRQLFKGRAAVRNARKLNKEIIRRTGRGINLAPGLPMSMEDETKHFLLVGASGSGKTQTLNSWIHQLLKQNSRMLLHDTKGDLTASLPDDNFILLAPHDQRSWAWDIAKDCQGIAAARELASRLIPEAKDPMWTNGAREILTGIIRTLQSRHGESWSWNDLHDTAYLSPQELEALLTVTHPEGARYIEVNPDTGTPDKTSFSFLVTLWSSIGAIVGPLASAWGQVPADKRISLCKWLLEDETDRPVLILQRSAEFDHLSKAWISAAIQLMANFAASPALHESQSRRIWLFLDEFSQLGKVEGFHQFLEVGRSKGIRSVIGVQDLEQLSNLYGKEAQKTWLNTIQTKIICRMNAGPSASYITNELIGNREVSWVEKTVSYSSNGTFDGRPETRNRSKQVKTATVPVIMPDYLERNLGPNTVNGETKIRALLLSHGDVFQLDWPLTIWSPKRPGTIPAPWTKH